MEECPGKFIKQSVEIFFIKKKMENILESEGFNWRFSWEIFEEFSEKTLVRISETHGGSFGEWILDEISRGSSRESPERNYWKKYWGNTWKML